jgi:DnaJ-class molecular chaperone
VVSLERIRVRIPPAVEEGGRMRVPGKGNRGFAGGPPGDLFLRLRVRPHPYFERRGLDTYGDLPVTVAEAVLGAELEVPTVDGPVRLTLPKGTPGGRRLRLAQRGLTSATGEVGDHYCRVRIIPPSWVDAETEGVLRRLRQPNPRENLPKEPL